MKEKFSCRATWSGLQAAFNYVFAGKIIVAAGQYALLTAGNVGESGLLLSVVWLSAASVAPEFVKQLPFGLSGQISAWSILGLTLLPELTLYTAIITCFNLWQNVAADVDRKWNGVWLVLYLFPTIIFICMTGATLVHVTADAKTIWQAPPWILQCRCLAGWSYGLIGLVKSNIKRVDSAAVIPSSPPAIQPKNTVPAVPSPALQKKIIATDLEDQISQIEPITEPEIIAIGSQNNQQASDTLDQDNQASVDHFEPENDPSPASGVPFLRENYDRIPLPGFDQNNQAGGDTKNAPTSGPKPAPIPVKLRVQKLLAKSPNLNPKEIASKLNISESYARRLAREVEQKTEQSAVQN